MDRGKPPERAQPKPRNNWLGFAAGVAVGALFALALYLLARGMQPDSGLLLLSVLLIPAASSCVAVMIAGIHGENYSFGKAAGMAAAVVTALLVGSAIFLREGAICLAMAAPLFYPIGIIGASLGAALAGNSGKRTPPSVIVILPLFLLPIEQQSAYPTMNAAVVSSVEIEAPIDIVWRNAVEIRDIAADEQSWTVTHDLLHIPRPMDATLTERDGAFVRAATWQGDVRFFEMITAWAPERAVAWTFDIPEAAADRMLDEHLRLDEGYLALKGGRYDVEALSPTRTRLTLTTQYAARTPLNFYARAWGDLLLGDIHRNVLNVVRRRAEADRPGA